MDNYISSTYFAAAPLLDIAAAITGDLVGWRQRVAIQGAHLDRSGLFAPMVITCSSVCWILK